MTTQRARSTPALERARAAQAQLRAQDRDRDAKVEQAQVTWFTATEGINDAQTRITTLEQQRVDAVGQLLDLGEPVTRIAKLCDADVTQIRSAQRQHTRRTKTAPPDTPDTAAPDKPAPSESHPR